MITKFLLFFILTFTLFSFAVAQADSADTNSDRPQIPYDALEDALRGIKCTLSDISFRTDYADPDSFRLPIIDSVTLDPLRMITFSDTLSRALFDKREFFFRNLAAFREYGFVQLQQVSSPKGRRESISLSQAKPDQKSVVRFRPDVDVSGLKKEGAFKALIDSSVQTLRYVRMTADRPFTEISEAHRAFIRDTLPRLILEDEGLEDAPVEVLDSLQQVEDSLMERFVDIAEKLILSQTYRKNRAYSDAECFDRMYSLSTLLADSIPKLVDSAAFEYPVETQQGRVIIGGYGENIGDNDYGNSPQMSGELPRLHRMACLDGALDPGRDKTLQVKRLSVRRDSGYPG